MKAIIGLGNPGSKYFNTRHNVGFATIDYLAAGPEFSSFRKRFQAEVSEGVLEILIADKAAKIEGKDRVEKTTSQSESILLVKPQTMMNLSGRSVREIVDFYKLELEDILVICDDIMLPLGKLRLRPSGSHGGQNGLRNIQEQLGSLDYPRLRIGIDGPNPHQDAADFVLSRFKPGEQSVIEDAIAIAGQSVLLWVREGIDRCMNKVNGGPEKKNDKKKLDPKDRPKKNEKKETGPPLITSTSIYMDATQRKNSRETEESNQSESIPIEDSKKTT